MELKTYSLIINWDDGDPEQGTFAATVRAPNDEEAELLVRELMVKSMMENYDYSHGEATNRAEEFGSCVECTIGATWAAADLEAALREILDNGTLHDDGTFVVKDGAGVERGFAALKRASDVSSEWGSLHYNDCPEPDWARFWSLEAHGVRYDEDLESISRHPDHSASFWTVYGVLYDGTSEAIQDCVSRAEAEHVLLAIARSGLPKIGKKEGRGAMHDRAQSFQSQIAISHALDRLREARDILATHGAPKAADKVRSALKSAEGAYRHAQSKATRIPEATHDR